MFSLLSKLLQPKKPEANMNPELHPEYLAIRKRMLNFTNEDMNLTIPNDGKVYAYLALVDIPVLDGYASIAMCFGSNCEVYFNNGTGDFELEKDESVKNASLRFLVSSTQVLHVMELTTDFAFKPSRNMRVFLKTTKGVYFKELDDSKESRFLETLIKNVEISMENYLKQRR